MATKTLIKDREMLLREAAKVRLREFLKQRFALRLYRPHAKQLEFHRCPKRLRMLFWGNRVGKTIAGAVEACYFALGRHPYRKLRGPMSGWIVSPSFEVQRDVAQPKVLEYLPENVIHRVIYREKAKNYIDKIILKVQTPGGFHYPEITFKSAEQGREAFQGTSVPWVWIDEETPLDIYQECLIRTMDCRGDIWGTMTPIIGELYLHIVEPEPGMEDEEAWVSFATWADNPYLPESEKRRLLQTMDEWEREVRTSGRWRPRSGLVLGMFREDIHVVDPDFLGWETGEPPESWRRLGGFDYGLSNPTVFLAAATNGEVLVFVGEYYAAERTAEQNAANIRAWMEKGYRRIKGDPSITQRGPDKRTVQQIYRQFGVPIIQGARGSGTWEQRIELWKQCLAYERDEATGVFSRTPKVYILRDRCPNLIKELRQLRWKVSRTGALHEDVTGPDHAIDAGGYILEDVAPVLLRPKAARKRLRQSRRRRNKYTGY